MSPLTGPDAYNYRVLCPKQFDRVFNVAVDARDFEIDVKKTLATPFGRTALDLLIKHGEVVPSNTSNPLDQNGQKQWQSLMAAATAADNKTVPGGSLPNVNSFRFRGRDKTQGDLIADKYFITIEPLDESDDK